MAAVSRVTDVAGSGWWCQHGDMINDGQWQQCSGTAPTPTLPVAPVFLGISNKEIVNCDMAREMLGLGGCME